MMARETLAEKPADKTAPERKVKQLDMNDALKNGQPIWLFRPDGQGVEGYWHKTRKWDVTTGKWVSEAFWAFSTPKGRPIDFEPTGWSRVLW